MAGYGTLARGRVELPPVGADQRPAADPFSGAGACLCPFSQPVPGAGKKPGLGDLSHRAHFFAAVLHSPVGLLYGSRPGGGGLSEPVFRPDFAALGALWPTLSMTGFDWAAVLLGLCPVVWLDIRKKQGKPLMPQNQGAVWVLITLLLVLTLTFGVYGSGYRAADFIYGRF